MKEVVDRIVQYPNRYKLTDVSTGQDMGTYDFTEVPGTVQQEGTEINAELFNSIEQDIEAAGNFDPSGTYPNLTAGNATNAASADYATSAGSASTATNAASADYATSAGSASTATNATHATSADSATKATQDGLGNDIANTYATKAEASSLKKYTHNITVKQPSSLFMFIMQWKSDDPTPINSYTALHTTLKNAGFYDGNSGRNEVINIKNWYPVLSYLLNDDSITNDFIAAGEDDVLSYIRLVQWETILERDAQDYTFSDVVLEN